MYIYVYVYIYTHLYTFIYIYIYIIYIYIPTLYAFSIMSYIKIKQSNIHKILVIFHLFTNLLRTYVYVFNLCSFKKEVFFR